MALSRDFCTHCLKAKSTCLCSLLAPFEAGPEFVILMHPKERRLRSGTGTGRLTHLCIRNSHLIEGTEFAHVERVKLYLNNPAYLPVVLFPGVQAINLALDTAPLSALLPKISTKLVVFVIDGTWACARKIMALNPWMAQLPWISFTPVNASRYHFKRQPKAECLSTIESIYELICLLNRANLYPTTPKNAHETLLKTFTAMVEQQAPFSTEEKRRKKKISPSTPVRPGSSQ